MSGGLRGKVLSFTAGNLSAQVATTLTGIYLARTLDLHQLGSYRQVILVVTTAGGMLSLGVPLSIFYFLPRIGSREEKSRWVGQTLLLLGGLGLACAALVLLGAGWLSARMNNPELGSLLRWASPLLLTAILVKYLAPFFLSMDRSRLAGVLRIVQSFSVSLVLVGLVAAGWPLGHALLGMALAEGLTLAVAFGLHRRVLPIRWSLSRGRLREQMAYALPLGLSGVVGLLSRQIDQFMVSGWFDTPTFALYSIGAVEVPVVPLVVASVSSVVLPQLARAFGAGELDEFHGLFARAQRKLSLFAVPVVLLAVAVAEPFLVFLYGDEFAASAPVFRIYCFILLNRLFMFGVLLQATGLSKIVLSGELSFLALNAVGNYLLLRWIGFLGPAIATWGAGLCIMAFYVWRVGHCEGIRRRELYRLRENVLLLLVGGVCALLSWRLAEALPAALWALALEGVVHLGLAMGLLLALRVIAPGEIWMLLPWRWRSSA